MQKNMTWEYLVSSLAGRNNIPEIEDVSLEKVVGLESDIRDYLSKHPQLNKLIRDNINVNIKKIKQEYFPNIDAYVIALEKFCDYFESTEIKKEEPEAAYDSHLSELVTKEELSSKFRGKFRSALKHLRKFPKMESVRPNLKVLDMARGLPYERILVKDFESPVDDPSQEKFFNNFKTILEKDRISRSEYYTTLVKIVKTYIKDLIPKIN